MSYRHTSRYCADPDAISAMKRDGLGWGHDLECGCFRTERRLETPGPVARLFASFKRRT